MKKYLALLLTLVLVIAVSVMAVSATTEDIDFSAGGTVSAVCPHCGGEEKVAWLPLTNALVTEWATDYTKATGTHYYLSEDTVTLTKNIVIGQGETLCLHLNGKSLTRGAGARAFNVSGTLNLMDHAANEGVITCVGTKTSGGCVVRVSAAGATFNMRGGTLEMRIGTTDNSSHAGNGGCVWVVEKGNFNLYGGVIKDGLSRDGGNVYIRANAKFTMTGGAILNGRTLDTTYTYTSDGMTNGLNGGNVYLAEGAQFTMTGGTIGTLKADGTCENGGTAVTYGGNIFSDGAIVSISGGTIAGGSSGKCGGNIYLASGAVFEMCGGIVDGGFATNYGGNIYGKSATIKIVDDGDASTAAPVVSNGEVTADNKGGGNIMADAGTLTITNAIISGGKAQYGGSIYCSGSMTANINAEISGGHALERGGNIYTSSIGTKVNITGGTISDGICNYNGGNIYANHGYITISGGVISGGKGKGGGNIYGNVGNADATEYPSTLNNYVKIDDDGNAATPLPVITGGIATESDRAGGNILSKGILHIGNCVIKDGVSPESGKDIMLTNSGKLTVFADFAGECGVDFFLNHMPVDANGEYLDATLDVCEGPFTGKLYWDADPDRPYLFGKEGDTKLYLTAAALVNKDGTYTFYKSNEELVAADSSNAVAIRPVAGELKLTGGNYVVDLYGRDVNITGTGNVTCYDSANSDFKTNGTATFNGPVLQNTTKGTVAGSEYYTTNDNGSYAFHLLDMRLTSVAVRPSNTGIYYQGVWLCDETLAERIKTFGVAVSLIGLPKENFKTSNGNLYTVYDQSEFVVGSERTGVLVSNILSENADNNFRSRKPVYAAAYIEFKDGSVAITDDNIAYSFYDAATIVSQNPETFATSIQPMGNLQKTWNLNWGLEFNVDPDVLQLQSVYAGKSVYHGELHDHSKSGKNADGKLTPNQWKIGLKQKKMDFAALVDHRQIEHMFADFWDPTIFIGGSEAAAMISDLPSGKNKIHINMLFAESEGYVNTVQSFAPFKYKNGYFSYPYDSNAISRDQVRELIGLIKENGGMFVQVHPKSSGYIDSEDPLDYWFEDWTGLEVFYGYSGYAPNQSINVKNYQLWTDLLALGKRIWATAGCDQHAAPQTTALTTIYADARNATAWMNEAKKGNLVCGPVGIRMTIGDTPMGSQTSFEGKRLVVSVGDIHNVAYYEDHTYRFDILSDTGVVYSQEFDQDTTTYYGMDADPNVKFYRVEIFDVTTDTRIAIGNPIWNEAFYD